MSKYTRKYNKNEKPDGFQLHHIIPRAYRNNFKSINLNDERNLVWVRADKHTGVGSLHQKPKEYISMVEEFQEQVKDLYNIKVSEIIDLYEEIKGNIENKRIKKLKKVGPITSAVGAKWNKWKEIKPYVSITEETERYVEPFAGMAGMFHRLCNEGYLTPDMEIILNDKDLITYEINHGIKIFNPEEILEIIEEYEKIVNKKWLYERFLRSGVTSKDEKEEQIKFLDDMFREVEGKELTVKKVAILIILKARSYGSNFYAEDEKGHVKKLNITNQGAGFKSKDKYINLLNVKAKIRIRDLHERYNKYDVKWMNVDAEDFIKTEKTRQPPRTYYFIDSPYLDDKQYTKYLKKGFESKAVFSEGYKLVFNLLKELELNGIKFLCTLNVKGKSVLKRIQEKDEEVKDKEWNYDIFNGKSKINKNKARIMDEAVFYN